MYKIGADDRSDAIFLKASEQGEVLFPGIPPRRIAQRIGQLRNPYDPVWLQAYSEKTLIEGAVEQKIMSEQHLRYSNYFR